MASIKRAPPQPPDSTSTRISINAVRVALTNVSLKDVIAEAFKMQRYQITGPDFLGAWRFDIVAKIPDGVPVLLIANKYDLGRHDSVPAQWAQQWPSEEIWRARLHRPSS